MEPDLTLERRLADYVGAIRLAVESVSEERRKAFVDAVLLAGQIVVAGRGRSGMMASAFARRLGQMGRHAWGLDDTTVPRLGSGDLLVAVTGSGTTPTVLSLMHTARQGGAQVVLITREPVREPGSADLILGLAVPVSSTDYPLGTLFEVSALALLDLVVVDLIEALGATESDLGARHTNLE